MTGTADTEAFELRQIYGLDVGGNPTDKPVKSPVSMQTICVLSDHGREVRSDS